MPCFGRDCVFQLRHKLGKIPSAAHRNRAFFIGKNMAPYNTTNVRQMNDFEFLAAIRKHPMRSQWEDVAAFDFAALRLAHMSGKRYLQTGNIKAFTHSMR